MTLPGGRDAAEIEALIADRYLELLLVAHGTGADLAPAPAELDPRVRAVADRLARDLPRVHPSFRFEEALAARLSSAALVRRLPMAAGAEGSIVSVPVAGGDEARALAAYVDGFPREDDPGSDPMRPLLIGGALTSAAISLAGAAWVAWRWRRPAGTPMGRAVRAVARGRLD